MTLLQMRYFLAVCRCQNITHAATELHIAQSTLSQSMQALEDETGLNLFLRAGRTIVISQAGQQLAQKLARLLQQVDQVEGEIRDMAMRHNKVRIAIPQQQASYLLPYLLSEFQQQHPEIQLDITEPYGLEAARLVRDEKSTWPSSTPMTAACRTSTTAGLPRAPSALSSGKIIRLRAARA